MIKIQPLSALLLMTAFASVITLASCEQRPSPSAEGVVASVNGTAITDADIDLASRGSARGHQANESSANKKNVLEGIIQQELAYQRAIELGLDTDPGYQAELSKLEAQVNTFKRKKLSEIFFRKELQEKTVASDTEVQQYFIENAARLRSEFNVWQILRRDENSIGKIQGELAQGLPFEEVAARLFPNLPDTARNPWELGYLQWSQLPETWRSVIHELKAGETSNIIHGPKNRFWIIKLIEKRENTDLNFELLKPKITDVLSNKKAQRIRGEIMQDLRDKARIEYSQ